MTSLSRIIRSTHNKLKMSVVEIKLQSFFEPIHYAETEEEQMMIPKINIEDIHNERERLL